MDFTVEEINLIAVYIADTKAATVSDILAALPCMDRDMLPIAVSAGRKLSALTEGEFAVMQFVPATDEGGGIVVLE